MTPARRLRRWARRLARPTRATGGLPACPYAAAAVRTGRATAAAVVPPRDGVLVLYFPDEAVGADLDALARLPLWRRLGLTALVSDPTRPIVVARRNVSQSRHKALLLQPTADLGRARVRLQASPYYQGWSKADKRRVGA